VLRNNLLMGLCLCLVATMAVGQNRVSPNDALPTKYEGAETCSNGGAAVVTQTPNAVNGYFSDADCAICGSGQQAIAETFTLAAATVIDQVNIWGGYFPGNILDNEPFNVIFHANAGGLPGANIDDQTVMATSQNATGPVIFGVNELFVVLDIAPVALAAGTYFVEVTTNTAGNTDQFFWETGTGPAGGAFAVEVPGVTWNALGDSLSMILCESVVPVELQSVEID